MEKQVELKTFYGFARPATGSFLWVGWRNIVYSLDLPSGQLYYRGGFPLLIDFFLSIGQHTAPTGWQLAYHICNPDSPTYDPETTPAAGTPAAGF